MQIRKHVDRQTKPPIWYTNKNGEELDPSCSDECFRLNVFSSRICGCTAACSLLLIISGRCYSELLVQEDCQNLTGSGTPPSASSALTASAISWSCCLDADLPRPWTPIKASRRADSAEFSATCFVVVCAAIAVHFFVTLLELCWPAWALWANRSTSLHDPLPRSSFPLPPQILVCAPQARQASPVWHTNAIARHSCSASSLSLSLGLSHTDILSSCSGIASFASFYTNGIKTSPSLFLYRFLHKRKRWFPTALDFSRTLSQTHLHSSTLRVPAWSLLLLSTQMESEDLHHCFCANHYSKEIADFHQPQIRERSPLTRHSPWKRGWHTETKKSRSNGDTSCFAKRTLFLWRRVITNRETFVVSSRKEEEPQIRHQIQIRVGFFRFTISELHSFQLPSLSIALWSSRTDTTTRLVIFLSGTVLCLHPIFKKRLELWNSS